VASILPLRVSKEVIVMKLTLIEKKHILWALDASVQESMRCDNLGWNALAGLGEVGKESELTKRTKALRDRFREEIKSEEGDKAPF